MISSCNPVLGARAFNFVIVISIANLSIRMTPESSPVSKGNIKLCSVSVTIMFLKEGRPDILLDLGFIIICKKR
jgi:Ca2+/Na+ antiporter